MVAFWCCKDVVAFFIYAVAYTGVVFLNRNTVKTLIQKVFIRRGSR